MTDEDWGLVKEIYREGIESRKATIVKILPAFEEWNLIHHPRLRFVAKFNGEITGFIALRDSGERIGEMSVYVKNEYKRRGIGTLLIRRMQEECSLCIHVLRSKIFFDNVASISLHKKMGFYLIDTITLNGDSRNIFVYEWRA
jgi:phosphinothricin acetyltransferase